MRATLIGSAGPLAGREFTLDAPVTTIGRRDENDIVIKDQTVSRKHAEIQQVGDELILRDNGSTSGTLVNGVPLSGEHRLRDGDTIVIGGSATFTVQLHPDDAATIAFSRDMLPSAPPAAPPPVGESRAESARYQEAGHTSMMPAIEPSFGSPPPLFGESAPPAHQEPPPPPHWGAPSAPPPEPPPAPHWGTPPPPLREEARPAARPPDYAAPPPEPSRFGPEPYYPTTPPPLSFEPPRPPAGMTPPPAGSFGFPQEPPAGSTLVSPPGPPPGFSGPPPGYGPGPGGPGLGAPPGMMMPPPPPARPASRGGGKRVALLLVVLLLVILIAVVVVAFLFLRSRSAVSIAPVADGWLPAALALATL